MGLLSCVSPTLDEASRSRLQCHSIFILVSCHRGHGPLGAQGVVTRRLLLLQHDTLAECAQTIYFGSDWLSTGCWTRIISFTGWVWSAVIHPRNINNATVKACFTRQCMVWCGMIGVSAHGALWTIWTYLYRAAHPSGSSQVSQAVLGPGNTSDNIAEFYTGQTVTTWTVFSYYSTHYCYESCLSNHYSTGGQLCSASISAGQYKL